MLLYVIICNNTYKFWSGMVDLIETKILSHHTSLYLNVYGQAHQVSKIIPPEAADPYAFYKSGSYGPD